MSVKDKIPDYHRQISNSDDVWVTVRMSKIIQEALTQSAQAIGVSVEQECYIRLCESIDDDLAEFSAIEYENKHAGPNWIDFIFNQKRAIDFKSINRSAR